MRRQRTIRTSADDLSALSGVSWQSSPRYDARSPRSINSEGTFDRSSIASSIVGHDDPTLVHANVKRNLSGKNDTIKNCHSEALDSFLTVSFSGEDENRDSAETERRDENLSDDELRQQLNELDQRQQAWGLKQQERSFEMDEAGDFYLKEVGELSVLSPKSPKKRSVFAPIKETIYEEEEIRESDVHEMESECSYDEEEDEEEEENHDDITSNRRSSGKQKARFRLVPRPRRQVEVGQKATKSQAKHTLENRQEEANEVSVPLEPKKNHSQTDTEEPFDCVNPQTQSEKSTKIDARRAEGPTTDVTNADISAHSARKIEDSTIAGRRMGGGIAIGMRRVEVSATDVEETQGPATDGKEAEYSTSNMIKANGKTEGGRNSEPSTRDRKNGEHSISGRRNSEHSTRGGRRTDTSISSRRNADDTTADVATRAVSFGLSFDGSDLDFDNFPGDGKKMSKNSDAAAHKIDGTVVEPSQRSDSRHFIDLEDSANAPNTSASIETKDSTNEIIRGVQERLFAFASKKWKEEALAIESFDSSDHERGVRLRSWLPTSFSNHSRGESKRSPRTAPQPISESKRSAWSGPQQTYASKRSAWGGPQQTLASKADRSRDEDDVDVDKVLHEKRKCKLLLVNSCLVLIVIAVIVYSVLFAMGLGKPISGKPSFDDESNGYSNMTIEDGFSNKTVDSEPNVIPADTMPSESESNVITGVTSTTESESTEVPGETAPSESESTEIPVETVPSESESTEVPVETAPSEIESTEVSGETSPSESESTVILEGQPPSDNESSVIRGETNVAPSSSESTEGPPTDTHTPTVSPTVSPTISATPSPTGSPSRSPTNSPSASTFQISSRVTPTAVSPNGNPIKDSTSTESPTYDAASVEGRLRAISGEVINNASTPQNKAYDWLVNEDPANLDLDSLSDEDLSQRYIAALLYFSLDGGNWFDQYDFLSNSHVCEWNNGSFRNRLGVICDSSDKITGFAINENNLRGQLPEELQHLSSLALFQFRANHIEGTLPSGLDKLSMLEEIDLRQNELVGSVPEAIFNLPEIRRILLLRNSQLSGTIPESIDKASNLEMLSFQKCHITGSIPSTIGNLSNLFFFTFMENLLTGSIPESVSNLSLLEVLELSGNQLTGLLPNLENQDFLYFLSLFDNKFRGTIPNSLGSLPKLMFLDVRNNQLSGSIPPSLGNLPDLVTFYARNNRLTGTLPSFAGNKGLLQAIHLSHNELTGEIVEFFAPGGPQDRLISVDLSVNNFTGSIPASIGFYDALSDLNLEGNKFSGTLPKAISYLTDMDTLSLGDNSFSGTLPEEIGLMEDLISLNLTNNRFEWTIPDSLSSLDKLKVLDMKSNLFVGSVPAVFNQLSNLDELYLNDNYLTGDLSEAFCSGFPFGYIETFAADCLEPEPAVTCECCTSCCSGENCLAI